MEDKRPSEAPGNWIGQAVELQIDRPLGSTHPRFENLRYEVNYGFVPGTRAADGSAIDGYVLGVAEPLERFEGLCIAILRRLDDVEDKLVLAPEGVALGGDEILHQVDFQERYFQTVLIRSAASI